MVELSRRWVAGAVLPLALLSVVLLTGKARPFSGSVLAASAALPPRSPQNWGAGGAARSRLVRGVDVSLYSGPVSTPSWARLKSKGWSFAVVGAWGSYGCNTLARQQLAAARAAGVTTGAYVLLHFDDPDKTGEWQVRQAVQSIGDELRHLKVIALDVEEKGGPVAVDPVDLIQSAVDEIARLGLPAVMYTKEKDWREMTGNSPAFAHLPLWVPRYDGVPKLGVSGKQPWRPFGGWKRQAAKQYKGTTDLHGVKVDLNIAEAGLWGL